MATTRWEKIGAKRGWWIKPADTVIKGQYAYSKEEAESILQGFKKISKYPDDINFREVWIYEDEGRTVWEPV